MVRLTTDLQNMLSTEVDLFRGLSAEEVQWLGKRLHHRAFPAGSNIMLVEQPGEVVYIILKGTVKIHVEQPDGKDVIIAILGPGDTVGEMSLLDSAGRSASVVTLEPSTMLWMDRSTFLESLARLPKVSNNLVSILLERLRLANEQIQTLASLTVHGRVARQILAFAERYGQQQPNGDVLISLQLTQSDVADLVGASRKRVNQVFVSYKQDGLISVDSNSYITVHDRGALQERCLEG